MADSISIYTRLSQEDINVDNKTKLESNSISSQKILIYQYIEEQEEFADCLITEYSDDGFSGTCFDRPQFIKLIEAAKTGRTDCIIVKDFSRFGRDYIEVGTYIDKVFPLIGVRFISINDNYDSARNFGTTGGMSIALKNMINMMYSRDISKKIKSSLTQKVKSGEYISGYVSYGYKRDEHNSHKLVVDEEAAKTIRLVFELTRTYKRPIDIVRYLNEHGAITASEYREKNGKKRFYNKEGKKTSWNYEMIRRIITNQVYIGNTVWNRLSRNLEKKIVENKTSDWIIAENTHEAIVSRELFEHAQEMYKNKRGKYKKENNTRNIFVCGNCGYSMTRYKSSRVCFCRKSTETKNTACSKARVNYGKLQEDVLAYVESAATIALANISKYKQQKECSNTKHQNKIEQLQNEKERHTSTKIALYTSYQDNEISKDEFIRKSMQITEKVKNIEKALSEEKKRHQKQQNSFEELDKKESLCNEIVKMKTFDEELLGKVIDKVKVYGKNEIEVIWRCNDCFMTCDSVE